MDLSNLELLIAKGNLEEAINWLLGNKNLYSKNIYNQIIAVSSWYNRLKNNEIIGTGTNISEYPKIVNALTFLINAIEEDKHQINNSSEEVIIYERKLMVKLLEIPDLKSKIETFEKMFQSTAQNPINLRLIFNQRKINFSFNCSANIQISLLKEQILSHFQFDHFVEHSSLINIKWRLSHFSKMLDDENQTLEYYNITNEDWIVIKLELSITNNGGGGGGGIFMVLDTLPG